MSIQEQIQLLEKIKQSQFDLDIVFEKYQFDQANVNKKIMEEIRAQYIAIFNQLQCTIEASLDDLNQQILTCIHNTQEIDRSFVSPTIRLDGELDGEPVNEHEISSESKSLADLKIKLTELHDSIGNLDSVKTRIGENVVFSNRFKEKFNSSKESIIKMIQECDACSKL